MNNQKGIASTLAIIIVIVIGVSAVGGVLAYQYYWSISDEEVEKETEEKVEIKPPEEIQIKIFLIALNDQGKSGKLIGCGDSAVAVTRTIQKTETPLKDSLEELLSIKDKFYGESGLYNFLYQSNLSLKSVSVKNKIAKIYLEGNIVLSGVCDDPRFEAQIIETAKQFSSVENAQIFINGKEFTTSGKGE